MASKNKRANILAKIANLRLEMFQSIKTKQSNKKELSLSDYQKKIKDLERQL